MSHMWQTYYNVSAASYAGLSFAEISFVAIVVIDKAVSLFLFAATARTLKRWCARFCILVSICVCVCLPVQTIKFLNYNCATKYELLIV